MTHRRNLNRKIYVNPWAWLKIIMARDTVNTEIGGYGECALDSLWYIEKFNIIDQKTTTVTVEFDDDKLNEYFNAKTDEGMHPVQYARIWIHTHPGNSTTPSGVDEETFNRVFGGCDWGIMMIVGKDNSIYARLRYNTGPKIDVILPVEVDWSDWHNVGSKPEFLEDAATWAAEIQEKIHPQTTTYSGSGYGSTYGGWGDGWGGEDYETWWEKSYPANGYKSTQPSATTRTTGDWEFDPKTRTWSAPPRPNGYDGANKSSSYTVVKPGEHSGFGAPDDDPPTTGLVPVKAYTDADLRWLKEEGGFSDAEILQMQQEDEAERAATIYKAPEDEFNDEPPQREDETDDQYLRRLYGEHVTIVRGPVGEED